MSEFTLTTKDGIEMKISRDAMKVVTVLNNAFEDTEDEETLVIPVPHVESADMKWIVEFCEHHAASEASANDGQANKTVQEVQEASEARAAWCKSFSARVGLPGWLTLLTAANYLNVAPLLELGIHTIADEIKDKTPEEIRASLNIANDFSPEEEEELREELKWAIMK